MHVTPLSLSLALPALDPPNATRRDATLNPDTSEAESRDSNGRDATQG